jgi:hypothetical protein
VVSSADTFNLLNDKSSTFEHLAKLQVWLSTRHSMHNPFGAFKFAQRSVSSCERSEGNEHALPAAFNLGKLDHQAIGTDLEGTYSKAALAREFGISRDTLYRYVPVKKRRVGKLAK